MSEGVSLIAGSLLPAVFVTPTSLVGMFGRAETTSANFLNSGEDRKQVCKGWPPVVAGRSAGLVNAGLTQPSCLYRFEQ